MRQTPRPGFALPLVACFAIASLAARAPEQAASALPPAREIVDRHVKAIGGREAVLAQSSTHATGTVSMPAAGLTGKLEAFHAKPNKYLQRLSLPGIGEIEEGFDGTVGWSISPLTGPILLEGKQLQQQSFDADFFGELKAPDRYQSMTTVEKTLFEGRPSYKIKLVKTSGDEDVEFYDVETGLKSGSVSTRESPMGAVQATTVTSDYKQFGGLLYATKMKVTLMGTQMVMSVSTVDYGKVDPAVFIPPAQIKALIK